MNKLSALALIICLTNGYNSSIPCANPEPCPLDLIVCQNGCFVTANNITQKIDPEYGECVCEFTCDQNLDKPAVVFEPEFNYTITNNTKSISFWSEPNNYTNIEQHCSAVPATDKVVPVDEWCKVLA